MHFTRRQNLLRLAICVVVTLSSIGVASAGTRLYTGSIRLRVASFFSSPTSYEIPFGAGISYPSLNNLPAGNLVSTHGKGTVAFTVGANQMTLMTSLSASKLPTSWSASFARTEFSAANESGNFDADGGPGTIVSSPLPYLPANGFGVSFKGSDVRFGGTMRVLGYSEAQFQYYGAGRSCFQYHKPWLCPLRTPLSAIGGSFGERATHYTWGGGTAWPPTFFTETIWGFPWTTGTVRAFAPAVQSLSAGTTLTAMGSDQRTSEGAGAIQLVSPFVVRRQIDWGGAGSQVSYRAGTAIMTLRFVPEPARMMQFALGLLVLTALHRFSLRNTGR